MCTKYWNLHAESQCPDCGSVKEREWQTHAHGDFGSCANHYRVGQPIPELAEAPDEEIGEMTTGCDDCGRSFYCEFRVRGGTVVALGAPYALDDGR